MKKLSTYINETERIDEAITKEGAIVAALILAASFCVPNVVGLIYQLGKYGFNLINRKKLLRELPDITTKEKEDLMQIIKDYDWNEESVFTKCIKDIESAETPEEIMDAIEAFYDATDGKGVWFPGLGNIGTTRWYDLIKTTREIYKTNKKYNERTDKELHLKWTISPLSWLEFVASASGGHSASRSGSRSGGGFGGGRSGGGGISGRW